MKHIPGWIRSSRAVAPALLTMAALATIATFAGPPAARAQDGGEFESELAHMGGMDGMRGGHGVRGMRGGMRGMRAMREHGHDLRLMEELDLTDRQKTQMSDLREAQERKMIGIRSGLEEAQLDLRKALRADEPSQAQIDAAIDRLSRLRGDAQKSRIATRLAVRNVLTDSQKKKLETLRKERWEKRGERSRGEKGDKGTSGRNSESSRRGA